jgi:hypothetical protein
MEVQSRSHRCYIIRRYTRDSLVSQIGRLIECEYRLSQLDLDLRLRRREFPEHRRRSVRIECDSHLAFRSHHRRELRCILILLRGAAVPRMCAEGAIQRHGGPTQSDHEYREATEVQQHVLILMQHFGILRFIRAGPVGGTVRLGVRSGTRTIVAGARDAAEQRGGAVE